MSQEFSDRHVVVTGGTGALGTAVVERLLAAGATCHIPCLDAGEHQRFPFRNHDRLHVEHPVDLSEEGQVTAFYDALPGLWASIHCAGGFAMGPFTETSLEAFHRQLSMNLDSCFLCCREAARAVARTADGDGGRLVNVAARPALEPRTGAGMVPYTVAKSGVAALTQALAQELAADRIWVNAVAPSIIDSAANRTAMPDADHAVWPTPGDLAETIVFLASPANRASRGAVVPVYGRA